MAQQPAKLAWKEKTPFGLSASQFGMALGFCGKVVDYVDYQRNIVGTEQEFKGNAATAHGIHTEAKARALYELLTGIQVYDGGFFLSDERMLGCSPDGRSFYYEPVSHSPSPHLRLASTGVASAPTGTASASLSSLVFPGKRSYSETDATPTYAHSSTTAVAGVAAGNEDSAVFPVSREPLPPPAQPYLLDDSTSGRLGNGPSVPSTSLAHAKPAFAVKIPFHSKRARSDVEIGSRKSLSEPVLTTTARLTPPSTSPLTQSDNTHPSHVPRTAAASSAAAVVVPSSGAPAARYPKRRLRLLEIKSPFRALYDCRKEGYRPFGIPLQYMCQMQGQMAIADAEECDFFVFLDAPRCQVEAWRVHRSRAFWSWAQPKLLQVVQWVRDGPPPSLDRSFVFEPFDFSTLTVEPLIFPYCISTGSPLNDASRFTYFHGFASPYDDKETGERATPSVGCVAQGNSGDVLPLHQRRRDDAMDTKAVEAIRSAVTRFLFDINTSPEVSDEDHSDDPPVPYSDEGPQRPRSHTLAMGAERPEELPPRDRRTATFRVRCTADDDFCEALIYEVFYKGRWGSRATAVDTVPVNGRDEVARHKDVAAPQQLLTARTFKQAEIRLTTPEDWEPGEVEVVVVANGVSCEGSQTEAARVRLFHRNLFVLLNRCPTAGAAPATEIRGASQSVASEPDVVVDETDRQLTPMPKRASRESSVASSLVFIDVSPMPRPKQQRPPKHPKLDDSRRSAEPDATAFAGKDGTTVITVLTPSKHDRAESLSQQIRVTLTPQPQHTAAADDHKGEGCPEGEGSRRSSGGESPKERRDSSAPPTPRVPVPPLVEEVTFKDLTLLLRETHDCAKVVLVESLQCPIRTFWRDSDFTVNDGAAADAGGGRRYELVLGDGFVLDAVAQMVDSRHLKDDTGGHVDCGWHRSVVSLARHLSDYVQWLATPGDTPSRSSPLKVVLCYLEPTTRSASREPTSVADVASGAACVPRRALTTPCFILRTQDSESVFRRLLEQLQQWGL